MLEFASIGEAHPRRLVNGGEEALVLETNGAAAFLFRLSLPFYLSARIELDPGFAGAVMERALLGGAQFVERCVQRKADMPGERLGKARERRAGCQFRPDRQRPFAERAARIANEQGWASALLHAQAFTRRTPAEWAVEREVVWVERFEAAAAAIAGEVQAELLDLPLRLRPLVVHMGNVQIAAAHLQPGLYRVGEPYA